jgi:7-keto-8-aminopelargonate synthetase-like enzyme
MGTLGKAVGAAGGFICGSRPLIDLLINSARSFIFSTAPVPASAAAAKSGVELIQSDEGRESCARLWKRVEQCRKGLQPVFEPAFAHEQTSNAGPLASRGDRLETFPTPILPLIVGDESDAVDAANALRESGFHIPAIRYPTVARGKARLRMTVTADHTSEDIDALGDALKEIINRRS